MESFKQFGVQPVLLLAQIVNFLIILFLLKRFFYKPIIKVLEDRKATIEESLKNADLIEERLTKTEESTAKILAEAQIQAQNLIADATANAQKMQDEANMEAKKMVGTLMQTAREQIESQKTQMKKELQDETLNLVVDVVKKVLERDLRETEKMKLTSDALTEIGKKI